MEYFVVIPILYWLWKQPPAVGETVQVATDHPAAAALGVGLVLSGVAHVIIPQCYAQFMPDLLPKATLVASIAGWLQMALGFSLMQKEVRPIATLLTFVMLVSFLPLCPANDRQPIHRPSRGHCLQRDPPGDPPRLGQLDHLGLPPGRSLGPRNDPRTAPAEDAPQAPPGQSSSSPNRKLRLLITRLS